jgi:hypothetical protein
VRQAPAGERAAGERQLAKRIKAATLLHFSGSCRLSHADPYRMFDDVKKRGEGERMRWLFRETTIS